MDLVLGFDTGRGDLVTTSDGLTAEPREGGRIPRVKEGLLDDAWGRLDAADAEFLKSLKGVVLVVKVGAAPLDIKAIELTDESHDLLRLAKEISHTDVEDNVALREVIGQEALLDRGWEWDDTFIRKREALLRDIAGD